MKTPYHVIWLKLRVCKNQIFLIFIHGSRRRVPLIRKYFQCVLDSCFENKKRIGQPECHVKVGRSFIRLSGNTVNRENIC